MNELLDVLDPKLSILYPVNDISKVRDVTYITFFFNYGNYDIV